MEMSLRDVLTDEETQYFLRNADQYKKKIPVRAVQMQKSFSVETHEGLMQGREGDYLVQNVEGDSKPWPVKKEIFEKTYALSAFGPRNCEKCQSIFVPTSKNQTRCDRNDDTPSSRC
jgi:hypothetical protein